MIPQRIAVEGFLCYRGRQVIDLAGYSLCMLSGPNGSGKSSVFDAVSFALFSNHRGGATGHHHLINHRADRATVEVEFLLEGRRFLAYRTITRQGDAAATTYEVRRWAGAPAGLPAGAAAPEPAGRKKKRPSRGRASPGAGPGGDGPSGGASGGDGAGGDGAGGGWETVEDTTSRDGFNRWVAQNVRLTYKTFTCSTLLRQGEADRLISSDPKERFAVLSGIVDLEKYARLADRAAGRKREAEGKAEALQHQLAGAPEVGDEQVRLAEQRADEARAGADAAEAEVGRLHRLHERSRAWAALRDKRDEARAMRRAHAAVLGRERPIEAARARLLELRAVVPLLGELAGQRARLEETERSARAAAEGTAAKQQEHARAAEDEAAARRAGEEAGRDLEAGAAREREASSGLAEAERQLAVAEPYERDREKLGEIRALLARLPAGPEAAAGQARRAWEALSALHLGLPWLRRLARSRDECAAAAARLAEARAASQANAAGAKQAEAAEEELRGRLAAAGAVLDSARRDDAEAHALLGVAEDELKQLGDLRGKPACPACGQPLSEEHRRLELARRREKVAGARRRGERAAAARGAAEAEFERVRQSAGGADEALRAVRRRAELLEAAVAQGAREVREHARRCDEAHAELAEPLRLRAGAPVPGDVPPADVPPAPWPAPQDLAALTAEVSALPAAREAMDEAHRVAQQVRELGARARDLEERLAGRPPGLPADLAPLRARRDELAGQCRTLAADLQARREGQQQRLAEARRLASRSAALEREIQSLDRRAGELRVAQDHLRDSIAAAGARLPAGWADLDGAFVAGELAGWREEARDLERAGAEEAFEALRQARAEAAGLDGRLAGLEADLSAAPEEARREPEAVAALLARADAEKAQRAAARRRAEAEKAALEQARRRRADLSELYLRADRDRRNFELLAELLGRKGLQLHLVRRAEREIVRCANAILNRLSGGDLFLQLRNGQSGDVEHAFELDALHQRGPAGVGRGEAGDGSDRPVHVNFLSGSQRFRVAVSLALAIGRYAGGRHRGGEAVIIDEGFGSLDREGQDVMIQELRRLKDVMRRIVLVSHQESFAGAFPDGYRFSLEQGETRVERREG